MVANEDASDAKLTNKTRAIPARPQTRREGHGPNGARLPPEPENRPTSGLPIAEPNPMHRG